jgi:preprotein translocase SecE subunit
VARDRQRAKQRKARRAGQNPGPGRSEPHRTNVPGELEHASGEADEFDAALVAGAGGRADEPDETGHEDDPDATDAHLTPEEESAEEAYEDDEDARLDEDEEDAALAQEAVAAAPTPSGRGAAASAPRAGAPARRSGPGRFIGFLRASWAELQRVQWPDRRQVAQATAVVLGFVVVAGLYLGVADRVAQDVVDLII